MAAAKTCDLYARVSSEQQDEANQLAALRRLAEARGLKVRRVWRERESAVKARPVLAAMLAEVRSGAVDAVAIWALDRLHRSMLGSIQTVLELDRLGVRVLSVQETWLDTDAKNPTRVLLVAIFGWVAEQERARMLERQAAARERLEREGRRWGRPERMNAAELATVKTMRAEGRSVRGIAIAMKVPKSTIARALARKERG